MAKDIWDGLKKARDKARHDKREDPVEQTPLRTLGSALEAIERGWGWSPGHRCYIRIGRHFDASFQPTKWAAIEIAPADFRFSSLDVEVAPWSPRQRYIAWWSPQADPKGNESVLARIGALRDLGPVTAYRQLVVDDNGEEVKD